MARFGYFIAVACAVWVIYDVWAKNKSLSDNAKIIWTISAVVFSVLTAVVYFFIGKEK